MPREAKEETMTITTLILLFNAYAQLLTSLAYLVIALRPPRPDR